MPNIFKKADDWMRRRMPPDFPHKPKQAPRDSMPEEPAPPPRGKKPGRKKDRPEKY
jgi:hypothetical protein